MNTTNSIRPNQGPTRSPFAIDRDLKAEGAYVVVCLAVLFALIVANRLVWAVAWFMATFFMFGIWRIARGNFK